MSMELAVTTSAAAEEEMVDVPLESTDESKIGEKKLSTSTTDVPVAMKAGKGKGDKDAEKEPPPPRVTFRQLYTYANTCDLIMVVIGVFNALATGAAMPLMLVGFGKKGGRGKRGDGS